jgi:AcrR family transcriptional regulator
VTSGSFYHYFGGWAGFVEALLTHWEAEQTQRIVELARAAADPEQRLDVLRQQATDLPHDAEAAIRAWGRGEQRVSQTQQRVDARRHAALLAIVSDLGVQPEDAERLATTGMALLVGMQQLQRPVDIDMLGAVFDELGRTIRDYAARAASTRR